MRDCGCGLCKTKDLSKCPDPQEVVYARCTHPYVYGKQHCPVCDQEALDNARADRRYYAP